MEVVLASTSPRRREILSLVGLKDFKVLPPKGKEVEVKTPEDVKRNAILKGKSVLKRLPYGDEYIVIASDTAVFIDNRFLGKPKNPEEAKRFLKTLSGRWHTVYTATAVFHKKGHRLRRKIVLDRTRVLFKKLSDREIDWYLQTGEPLDKAGAYGIQGYGALFIEKIVGDYFTVMGLSPNKLYKALVELLGEKRALELFGKRD